MVSHVVCMTISRYINVIKGTMATMQCFQNLFLALHRFTNRVTHDNAANHSCLKIIRTYINII